MTDNTKIREALLKFGDENPSLDLDFRLHTHGKYLTQEKAIVASRAFKAGAAWQAAQSVPVVGEPVGFLLLYEDGGKNLTFHDNTGELSDGWSQHQLVIQPAHSIPAAEIERLRKDAEHLPALEHTLRHLGRELAKLDKYRLCMSYNDSYFGEPAGTVKRVVVELRHCIDAAIAQGKGE